MDAVEQAKQNLTAHNNLKHFKTICAEWLNDESLIAIHQFLHTQGFQVDVWERKGNGWIVSSGNHIVCGPLEAAMSVYMRRLARCRT